MKTKLWAKKQTQQIIKQLRAANIPINKIDSGYVSVKNVDGKPIFKAMIGNHGYLVQYIDNLFIAA